MTRLLPLALLLAACRQDPTEATFTQNVGAAFAECNAPEIRFLAGKHNFMTAFDPCGSNNFEDYAWSPEGTHLYFQLTQSAHIMDAQADDKRTTTLPTETPVGPGTWITASRLVLPVQGAEGERGIRLAIYDREQPSLHYVSLPEITTVTDLVRGPTTSDVFALVPKGEKHQIVRVQLDDGSIERDPYPFLAGGVDTLTYTPAVDRLAVGVDDTVTLYDSLGGTHGSWAPARRGVVHSEGRWLALEHEGDAVSIFYQRAWDELSENARERELRRAKAWEDQLPDWYPKEVRPPTLSVVDLENGSRWMFTGFYGHHFQWYEAAPYYASLILWGFEGKQLNRNVLLGNLGERLRSIGQGEEIFGVVKWPEPGAVPPGEAATPDAPAEAPPAP